MNTLDTLKAIGIRYHLMLWYSLLFMAILAVAGWITFSLVAKTPFPCSPRN